MISKEFCLNLVEQIKYKLVNVQPDNAVIVNPRALSADGFRNFPKITRARQ